MASFISEDNIEQALLQRLQHIHGFNVLDCYTRRGYLGKGMVVTLDKFTAVRMYDKV